MRTSILQPDRSPETVGTQERPAGQKERAARRAEPSHFDVTTQLNSAARFGHRLENVVVESTARSGRDSRQPLPDPLSRSLLSSSEATHGPELGESDPVQLKKNKNRFKGQRMSLAEFHEREGQREQTQQQQIRQDFQQQVAPQLGPAAAAFRQRQQNRQNPNRRYLPYDPGLWRRRGGASPTSDRGQMISDPDNKTHAKFHEDRDLPGTFSEFHIADERKRKSGRNVYFDVPGGPGHTESRAFAHGPREESESRFHSEQAGEFDRFRKSSLRNEAQAQASENAQQGVWRTPQVTPEMAAGMNQQEARDYLRRREQDERATRRANIRRGSRQAYEAEKSRQGSRDEGAVVGVDPRQVNTPIPEDGNAEDNETWATHFQWPDEDNEDQ